jgi:pyruvate,water dikinase
MEYYYYLEDRFLKRWKAPIINDYLCMIFFGLLKKLTASWVATADEAESLQNDLLCGEGGLDSTEPTKFLMRTAARIDQGDPGFRAWFVNTPVPDALRALQGEKHDHPVGRALSEFLDRFGFRCVNELKLEVLDLHDDPSFVIQSLISYVRTKSYNVEEMEKREKDIRSQAELRLNARISGWRKQLYWFVLKQARRAVKNRENLRFARTKSFGVVRHLFRAIGSHLTTLKVIDKEMDIFYLTLDEISSYIEGRVVGTNLRQLIAMRHVEFENYRNTPSPPERFLSHGAVGVSVASLPVLLEADLLRDLHAAASQDPNKLFGTPCCPGIIEGEVRLVNDMKDAEGIDGHILVTARTDPGWVPLFPSCSGLLVERGSLLSHSAVVARELGLPTIVGINGGLMQRLKTGDRIRIDAGKGEVTILSKGA